MLGLHQKVEGHFPRLGGLIGQKHGLRRTRRKTHIDHTGKQALGRRHVLAPGAVDFHHRGNAFGAVGESRNGLRAAGFVHLVDSAKLGRIEAGRVDGSIGQGRGDQHNAWHASNLRRHRLHVHHGRKAPAASRHIEAN
ncbi:unannotated protein [freshwater metagenome]|uniref:Unannotated protein n=1 Tax=freshwater metagenome TaxID=449393 RepID=A0A6J7RYV7_9ZZZZ